MTPEEQRIAIAKGCGYTNVRRCSCNPDGSKEWLSGTRNDGVDVAHIKDFLTDLNAIHEAEKTIWDDQELSVKFCMELDKICQPLRETVLSGAESIFGYTGWIAHATAAQRAEAFLRAKGLWKE